MAPSRAAARRWTLVDGVDPSATWSGPRPRCSIPLAAWYVADILADVPPPETALRAASPTRPARPTAIATPGRSASTAGRDRRLGWTSGRHVGARPDRHQFRRAAPVRELRPARRADRAAQGTAARGRFRRQCAIARTAATFPPSQRGADRQEPCSGNHLPVGRRRRRSRLQGGARHRARHQGAQWRVALHLFRQWFAV